MIGELFINDKDAHKTWGVFLDDTGLSTLMTPAPLKDYITNKSPLNNGKDVKPWTPKVDERDLTLVLYLVAPDRETFLSRYNAFVTDVLQAGELTLKTKYSDDVYHLLYVSCQQFSTYRMGVGKFTLKLNEPNPLNRT